MKSGETERFLRLAPEKKGRVLEAAIREFADKGYAGASMNRVVQEAGISKGALFQYFGSKSGLFVYVYKMAFGLVKDYLRAVREETKDEDFFMRLERIMDAGIRFIQTQPGLARIYYHLLYTGDSPYQEEMLRELKRESHRFIRSLVEHGMDKGQVRRDLDPDTAAFMLQSVLDRFLQAHHLEITAGPLRQGMGETDRPNITELVALFRQGMGAPGSGT